MTVSYTHLDVYKRQAIEQSIMNLGILMVQGLVNSFGFLTSAAFAAVVKIDAFAYMPAQDFGNAFTTYIAQNYGAGKPDRIKKGLRSAVFISIGFCAAASVTCLLYTSFDSWFLGIPCLCELQRRTVL